MNNELLNRIKEIKTENIFFGIFIVLIIIGYYANKREIDYFLTKDESAKKDYYYIMIIIFIIVVTISSYYFYQSYQEVIKLQNKTYSKEKEYANLELIASELALIAGIIYLYIAITDTNIETEISL